MTQNQVIQQIKMFYCSHLKLRQYLNSLEKDSGSLGIYTTKNRIENEIANFQKCYTQYCGMDIYKELNNILIVEFHNIMDIKIIKNEIVALNSISNKILTNIIAKQQFKDCIIQISTEYRKIYQIIKQNRVPIVLINISK